MIVVLPHRGSKNAKPALANARADLPQTQLQLTYLFQPIQLQQIMWIPLTLREKPGVKLFPWSKVDAIHIDSESVDEVIDDDETETPWVDEEEFMAAKNVGYSVSEARISITAFFTIIGLSIWFTGFAIDVFTIDWSFGADVRK